ncbi:hypothetical protein NL676_038397 [Syzygium grande]|nr:hypothetical protein NL676_038397 [Syzygium grande]
MRKLNWNTSVGVENLGGIGGRGLGRLRDPRTWTLKSLVLVTQYFDTMKEMASFEMFSSRMGRREHPDQGRVFRPTYKWGCGTNVNERLELRTWADRDLGADDLDTKVWSPGMAFEISGTSTRVLGPPQGQMTAFVDLRLDVEKLSCLDGLKCQRTTVKNSGTSIEVIALRVIKDLGLAFVGPNSTLVTWAWGIGYPTVHWGLGSTSKRLGRDMALPSRDLGLAFVELGPRAVFNHPGMGLGMVVGSLCPCSTAKA